MRGKFSGQLGIFSYVDTKATEAGTRQDKGGWLGTTLKSLGLSSDHDAEVATHLSQQADCQLMI